MSRLRSEPQAANISVEDARTGRHLGKSGEIEKAIMNQILVKSSNSGKVIRVDG